MLQACCDTGLCELPGASLKKKVSGNLFRQPTKDSNAQDDTCQLQEVDLLWAVSLSSCSDTGCCMFDVILATMRQRP